MTIRYVHNDPEASLPVESERTPAEDRPPGRAQFALTSPPPDEGIYPDGDERFVFWQSREAAHAAVAAWEEVDGPLASWQSGAGSTLALIPNAGGGLAGAYTRTALKFYSSEANPPAFFAAASADAVAHEVGHAVLDSIQPTLWDSVYPEVAAFHEAFADCLTLLVAIFDDAVREELFSSTGQPGSVLDQPNLIATIAESVAAAFAVSFGPNDPNSVSRELLNDLQWAIPTTLPRSPTPANLSSEAHSFGRIFTGCFYDLINRIFKAGQPTSSGLRSAAATAGGLLAAAVRSAPEEIRFFRSVGRAMALAERQRGNAHGSAIHDAFRGHNIALGSSAMLAPAMALAGPPPDSVSLNARTLRDLRSRLNTPRHTRIRMAPVTLGTDPVWRAEFKRDVDLGTVDRELEGVVARSSHGVLLGASGNRCAVLGGLPDARASEEEAEAFVASLMAKGDVATGGRVAARRGWGPTHTVRRRGGRRVLSRVCFSCGSHRRDPDL